MSSGAEFNRTPLVPAAGSWVNQAACAGADPELWFAQEHGVGNGKNFTPETAEALRICRDLCPVSAECLTYALDVPWSEDYGVWGGMLRSEREGLRKLKRRAV